MEFAGWSQPIEAYAMALEAAGFAITALREPVPDAAGSAHPGALDPAAPLPVAEGAAVRGRRVRLPVAVRLALRELRGGLAGFRVFLPASRSGWRRSRRWGRCGRPSTAGWPARRRRSSAATPRSSSPTASPPTPSAPGWSGTRARSSEIVDFRSLLAMPRGRRGRRATADARHGQGGRRRLSAGRPGRARRGGSLAAALAPHDGLPGLVAEKALARPLGARARAPWSASARPRLPADRASCWRSPTRGAGLHRAGAAGDRAARPTSPRAACSAEGSMFNSSYRLRLAPDADLAALWRRRAWRISARRAAVARPTGRRAGIGSFVDRLGSFLVLVGLAGLAVGGVGVAAAVRAHLEEKTATIATLKTLGASGGDGLRGLSGRDRHPRRPRDRRRAGARGGAAAGRGPLRAARCCRCRPSSVIYPRPLAEAALYGGLTALLFTVWPLARARDIRAAELYRDLTAARRAWPRRGLRRRDLRAGRGARRRGHPLLGRPGTRARHRRGGRRGPPGARRRGGGAAPAGAAARPRRPDPRPSGAALGAGGARRAFGRDRLGGAGARARAERAGGDRPGRLEPAHAGRARPAGPGAGVLLHRHPGRRARRLPCDRRRRRRESAR